MPITNFINEPARQTPVAHECDIAVIGGSCTGVFAAIAAARLGASVAVIENSNGFGGTATLGLVCVWHTMMDTEFKRQIAAGLPSELLDRLSRRAAVDDRGPGKDLQFIFRPYEMMIELDEMIREAKVRPFLHTRFVAPVMDGDRIDAVIVEDQTGRRAIRAKAFVDASGDSLLVHRAGLPTYRLGQLQPPTTCALVKGIGRIRESVPGFSFDWFFDRKYPEALPHGFAWGAPLRDQGDLELVAGTRVHGADCSDADQLTDAEIEGRRQVRAITDILRRVAPEPKEISVLALPGKIGVRQTRQTRCLHELTEAEVLNGTRFPDAVVNGSYRVDVHSANGAGLVFRYQNGVEQVIVPNERSPAGRWRDPIPVDPTFWQVPYRSLVPVGAKNVLVAGRCLDADEGAFGAVRVMINTTQMGEAAGTAAWLSLDSGRDVAEIDTDQLRAQLSRQGAVML